MAIFTLQTPTYDAPSDVTKYGQAGGTPSHRFFYNTPGETLTLDPGYDSADPRDRQFPRNPAVEQPSMSDMLLGAGTTYLANTTGTNAGRYAYDQLAETGVQPSLWDSGAAGFEKTLGDVGDFASGLGRGVRDRFV